MKKANKHVNISVFVSVIHSLRLGINYDKCNRYMNEILVVINLIEIQISSLFILYE